MNFKNSVTKKFWKNVAWMSEQELLAFFFAQVDELLEGLEIKLNPKKFEKSLIASVPYMGYVKSDLGEEMFEIFIDKLEKMFNQAITQRNTKIAKLRKELK